MTIRRSNRVQRSAQPVAARRLSRRTLLRGLGAAVPLPWLDAMQATRAAVAGAAEASFPNRMAILYVPNGQHMPDWTPAAVGADFELSPILAPLANVREKLLVLSGLVSNPARNRGAGHAPALATFLTGVPPHKTDGPEIRGGTSADQVAAGRIGHRTRLASLEIGAEHGTLSGNCDTGYNCIYNSALSWRSATQPMPKEINPKLVFERLFGGGDPATVARDRRRKSLLDFVREDARGLEQRLGAADRRKLDEYLSSVRDIELRIERAASMPPVAVPDVPAPAGMPADYAENIRLMNELVVLAFQADVTRIVTFTVANEASNRPYPMLDVAEGHHDLSHHGNDPEKQAKIRKINTFHAGHLAHLLERLDGIAEGEGTLLDHAMVAYGSGIHDGNKHNYENLPILLAGGGCGTLSPGRHVRYPDETPLANLWMSLLARMDVAADRFGDATGSLPALEQA
jgi:hypothetical protein